MSEKLNLPLFNKHKELLPKQNELRKLQNEIINEKIKEHSIPVQETIETVKTSLNNIRDYLQNINGRKATTLIRLQEESKKLENDKNNLLPPLKNHRELQSIIESKEEIDNLLLSLQESENVNILELAQTFPVETSCAKNKQFANDISAFRTMEDLHENVINIVNRDQNSTLENKNQSIDDSDLGCYPYPDNSMKFLTSSPLSCSYRQLNIN